MKLANLQNSRKVQHLVFLLVGVFLMAMPSARAADLIENFGATTCATQTSGLSITQGGNAIGTTDAHGALSISRTYAGMYGLIGCYLQFGAITASSVVTFPSSSRPNTFSFLKTAVDWGQAAQLTYVDSTTETFTVGATNGGNSSIQTVTGNGKLITSVTFYDGGNGVDYWFLDNLTWSAGVPAVSTTQITNSQSAVEKGRPTTLTTTVSTAGYVSFKLNGRNIPGCSRVATSNLIAQCVWRPQVTGAAVITANLTPSDLSKPSSSSLKIMKVISRRTLR